jgi:hypothetical protein
MARYSDLTGGGRAGQSRVGQIVGVETALVVLALLVYVCRIFSRIRPVRNLSWDDYFMTAAIVRIVPGPSLVADHSPIAMWSGQLYRVHAEHPQRIWQAHRVRYAGANRELLTTGVHLRALVGVESDVHEDFGGIHVSPDTKLYRLGNDHEHRHILLGCVGRRHHEPAVHRMRSSEDVLGAGNAWRQMPVSCVRSNGHRRHIRYVGCSHCCHIFDIQSR